MYHCQYMYSDIQCCQTEKSVKTVDVRMTSLVIFCVYVYVCEKVSDRGAAAVVKIVPVS